MGAILVEYWPCCHQLSLWGLAHVVDQPCHYHTQDSSKRCPKCPWETWTKWNLFIRKRNEVFRYTPSNETTTICVKQAALRLVDRLARDVPQPVSVGKSSRRRDPVEFLGSFWNISLVYKFVVCYIYSLVCNGIRLIPSRTNVRLGFCDS